MADEPGTERVEGRGHVPSEQGGNQRPAPQPAEAAAGNGGSTAPDAKPDQEQPKDQDQNQKPAGGWTKPRTWSWKRWLALVIVALVLLAAVIFGLLYWLHARHFESTDDAFIDGHIIQAAPQVGGRVIRRPVDDNVAVAAGQLLVEIDPAEYQASLRQAQAGVAQAEAAQAQAQSGQAQAQAQLAQAKAQVDAAVANVQQAQGDVDVAEATLKNVLADLRRYEQLGPQGITQQTIDTSKTQAANQRSMLEVARRRVAAQQAQLELARAQVAAAEAGVKSAGAQAAAAAANVKAAQAEEETARLNLSYTRVYAASPGHVARLSVEVGDYVQPGQDLMAIVEPDIWVTANYKETQLADMRPGQPVEISVDAYPGRKFHGHVDSIQRGSGAQFSLLPPENATGNYVKVVQRVPVKILFDDRQDQDFVLGPGMSVEPEVKVR